MTKILNINKVQDSLHGRKARIYVRILSFFVFLFVFYQFRLNYWYMPMTINLAASCAIGGLLASLGLFLSSFEAIRRRSWIGFLLYTPTFPVIVLFSGSISIVVPFLALFILYPYFVFFRKRVQ